MTSQMPMDDTSLCRRILSSVFLETNISNLVRGQSEDSEGNFERD